jgi:ankyrin repeat protein
VYTRWQESKSNLLWIYGKPGSGKSTLAATIVQSLCNQQGLDYVVADFFYSARGGSTETSHTLMLRSILYQLLQQKPSLYTMFQRTFRRLRAKYSEKIMWPYTELRPILIDLASNKEDHHFLLIVDGLDESEWRVADGPTRQKVLSIFTSLTSTVFKVIALSREEPDIRKALKTDYAIDMKSVNESDISTIVRAGMAILWRHILSEVESNGTFLSTFPHSNTFNDSDDSDYATRSRAMLRRASRAIEVGIDHENTSMTGEFPDVPELDTVRDHLLNHADGVILWVVMIIRRLIKVAQSGTCTLGQLNESLQRIPNSLKDLYCDIISKIKDSPSTDERLSQHIFSWSCFTGRPLRVNEMRDAVAMFYWKPGSDQAFEVFLKRNRVGDLQKSWDPLRTYLLDMSGGLIETVSLESEPLSNILDSFSQKRPLSPYDGVQLIHTTAKEFLLDSKSPFLDLNKSKSLDLISDACIGYLTMSFLRNEPPILEQHQKVHNIDARLLLQLIDDRPMLAYVLEQLPAHLQDEGWEQSSRVTACSKLIDFLQMMKLKIKSPIWDILGVWSFFNFIVNDRIGTTSSVEDLRAGFSSKILRITSPQSLLRHRSASNDSSTDSSEDQRLLSSCSFLNKSLDYACSGGSLDQVRIILDLCLHAGINGSNIDTPLCIAARNGHEAVVKLLLEKGAELEAKDRDSRTPLSWAAENGYGAVVKLLLEKGAELEAESRDSRTPLSWAARNGHEAVVKLLLEKGAELEAKDRDTRTPLSWAAENGYDAVVKLLLEKGAELEAKDRDSRTPLSWAARNGYGAVVKLLLEKGAELEAESKGGRTPLSWAAGNGHEAVVKLLLEKGAELEAESRGGWTPLSWAARNGHEAVVKLLLEMGAELEAESRGGRTPLSWAAGNGHEAVVKLLLEKGAKKSQ